MIVKRYMEALLGMPVLVIGESCLNKLDNLYRHHNIFGFAYGRRALWRIIGVIEKSKGQKYVKMEKVNKGGETI